MGTNESERTHAGASPAREPHWITVVATLLATIAGAVLISVVGSGRLP